MSLEKDTLAILAHLAENLGQTIDYVTDGDPDSHDCVHGDKPWLNIYITPGEIRPMACGLNLITDSGILSIELYVRTGSDPVLRDRLIDRLRPLFLAKRIGNIQFDGEVKVVQKRPSEIGWHQTLIFVYFRSTEAP